MLLVYKGTQSAKINMLELATNWNINFDSKIARRSLSYACYQVTFFTSVMSLTSVS